MKQNFTLLAVCMTIVLGVFLGFNITSDPTGSRSNTIDRTISNLPTPEYDNSVVKFQDNMDGANDTVALHSRGYKTYYRGTGPQGLTATWFQPSATPPFPAFNGPTTGYAAANFNAVTGVNNIDSWLVLPALNLSAGDTLSFYANSTGSTWVDSITVSYSAAGDSVPEAGSWVTLGKFKVNAGWALNNYIAPSGGSNARFAIRYKVVNGGPSGTNSDYIGVDAITVHGPSGPPPPMGCGVTAGMWAPGSTYPAMPVANYFSSSAWLGDTLYVQSAGAGTGSTTVYRYTIGGSWTTGVAAPVPATGASLTAANGKLYLIGGGVAGAITTGSTGVYEYDPSTGAWTTRANLPTALSGHGAVNWGDSVIFVVGGPYTGSGTNLNVQYYRIASNTWGTITGSLPSGQGRRTFGLGISGNKIVMSAGFNTAFLKSTYVGTIGSNASSITWTAAPDVPTTYAGLSRPGGASFDKFFFLVNGERGGLGGYYDTTHVFDVNANSWIGIIPSKPVATSNIFSQTTARCVNDTIKIFVPGAYNGAGSTAFDVTQSGVLTGIEQPGMNLPDQYSLSQNYPNPFNPTTKISFAIPKMSFVTLKIYDITGREVASLINDIRGAGTYLVDFDGHNLSSGTYFYKIQAGDFVQVKKMVLLK